MHGDGVDALKDILFGSTAGIVSEIFEYPFDLAKVRLQSQLLTGDKQFNGPLDCLVKTWKHEGIVGLYRGLPVPLVGSMAETAAIFVAYSTFQNLIRKFTNTQGELSIPQLATASAGAGAVTSFILTPIELVKCKIQVQMMNTHTPPRIPPVGFVTSTTSLSPLDPPQSKFLLPPRNQPYEPLPGPFSIIKTVVQNNGVRGLWLGHVGTLLRETGGTASWFAMKEYVARLLVARRTPSSSTLEPFALLPWESAVAGSVSGAFCVAALYPADTVKSAMQTEEELRSHRVSTATAAREWTTTATHGSHSHTRPSFPAPPAIPRPTTPTFMATLSTIYRAHGIRGLYSGGGMTMARAVPSSGIVFVVYDGLVQYFS
ncbi:mitochondrial carrier [Dendrothele bispora CBS 962.96]|uniref:Mitochondrial carrier n=1 Tax=Dendrothele bispora (strain CBS 962.96) TaxID=1314807 RepID=A0A4S8KZS6_DENBC|nr:mitochondrial carrier [Dendrothele bispora CBS 962.96]